MDKIDNLISEIKPRIHTNGHEKFKSRNGQAYPSFYAVGKHGVPEGQFENSPAFERRGLAILPTSPAGTVENGTYRVATLAKTGFVSAVPAGLDVFSTGSRH